MSISFTIDRINANTVQLNWTSSATGNASWIFADGELVAGPIKPGTTARSYQVQSSKDYTYAWEIQDSDGTPESAVATANYLPVVSWRTVASASSYTLRINDLLVKVVRADSTVARQSTRVPARLADGWSKIEVIATDGTGDTEVSDIRWFRAYTPGPPVPSIAITDGSGAGLYDITIP